MSGISSHVLDTSRGRPAQGVAIRLERWSNENGGSWIALAQAITGADGRVIGLEGPGGLVTGTHRLCFDTGAYFRLVGATVFYPEVQVSFSVAAVTEHYHIPLLLSPYGYSTYRGS